MANLTDFVIRELPTMEIPLNKSSTVRTNLHALYTNFKSPMGPIGSSTEHGSKLQKSIMNALDGPEDGLERLAFERDPQRIHQYAGIYRPKLQGIPDSLLKRMAIQDDLVAAVVHTRSNHVAQFGRKQVDRHQKGFKFVINEGIEEKLKEEDKQKLHDRIDRAEKILSTCGHSNGWAEQEKCSFSEFLYMQARNCVVVGRMATEIIWTPDSNFPDDKKKRKFHSFRPTDAGTIYYAAPYHEVNSQVREMALRLMENLKNEKLKKEKFENDEYAWVQVFEGRPMQAFGPQEMLVHSPYQVADIEQMGYPVTPLDTAITAVTTHINITHHNRLYFQTGRAARGMLIINSPDLDPDIVQGIKQQFNASINSVSNSWRMPVFGLGPEDKLVWAPIDSAGGRDMEFQYLSDSNARSILAAFQMSPEELPGYQHLGKGTNSQAISESSNEFKLIAARDVGIRPLLSSFEDFLNSSIVPLIDPELSKIVKLRLIGLDADTEEKESIRLEQDQGIWMSFNNILSRLEKKNLPKKLAADIPLNQVYFQYLQFFVPFGEILENFCGVQGASQDPKNQFYMNPFWQEHQAQLQAQIQSQQQQSSASTSTTAPPSEDRSLEGGIDQLLQMVSKSENLTKDEIGSLKEKAKKIRTRNVLANKIIIESFSKDTENKIKSITGIALNTKIKKS